MIVSQSEYFIDFIVMVTSEIERGAAIASSFHSGILLPVSRDLQFHTHDSMVVPSDGSSTTTSSQPRVTINGQEAGED